MPVPQYDFLKDEAIETVALIEAQYTPVSGKEETIVAVGAYQMSPASVWTCSARAAMSLRE